LESFSFVAWRAAMQREPPFMGERQILGLGHDLTAALAA
jgi:hypothetical protein